MPERSMVNGKVGKIMPYLCDRAEEKCFRAARAAAELRDSRATFLLVIAINSAFSGPDIWLFPEDLTLLLWLRLGLVNVVNVVNVFPGSHSQTRAPPRTCKVWENVHNVHTIRICPYIPMRYL